MSYLDEDFEITKSGKKIQPNNYWKEKQKSLESRNNKTPSKIRFIEEKDFEDISTMSKDGIHHY